MRPVLGIGRPVLGIGRPVLGMGRPVLGIGRPVLGMIFGIRGHTGEASLAPTNHIGL